MGDRACQNFQKNDTDIIALQTAELMGFKLGQAAAKTRRRLKGANQLPRVIESVAFTDVVAVTKPHRLIRPRHPKTAIAQLDPPVHRGKGRCHPVSCIEYGPQNDRGNRLSGDEH